MKELTGAIGQNPSFNCPDLPIPTRTVNSSISLGFRTVFFLQNRKHLTTISVGAYKDTTGTAPKVGSELRSGDINMKGSKSDLGVGETRKKKGTHAHRAACGRTDGQMHMEHDMFSHGSRPSYLFYRCSAMDAQWTLNGRYNGRSMDA